MEHAINIERDNTSLASEKDNDSSQWINNLCQVKQTKDLNAGIDNTIHRDDRETNSTDQDNNGNNNNSNNNNRKRQKVDPSKIIHASLLQDITINFDLNVTGVDNFNNMFHPVEIPICLTMNANNDDPSFHVSIDSNSTDNKTLFSFKIKNTNNNSLNDNISSLLLLLLSNKSQEKKLTTEITTLKRLNNNKENNKIKSIRNNNLRPIKKITRDIDFSFLNLCISISTSGNISLQIKSNILLLYRENQNNKFATHSNKLLDLLYEKWNKNDCNNATNNINKSFIDLSKVKQKSNFIQRQFFNQSIKYTANKLKAITPTFGSVPNLNLTLLPFQEKSVQWMLNRELNDYSKKYLNNQQIDSTSRINKFLNDKICFGYEILNVKDINNNNDSNLFWNKFTGFILSETTALQLFNSYYHTNTNYPRTGTKGLLSEEMGLGKTIEILSLILLNKRDLSIEKDLTRINNERKRIHKTGVTLIICPNPLLKQWINEIETHTRENSISIFNYLGYNDVIKRFNTSDINEIINALSKFDIIITTYSVINLEIHYAQFNANLRPRRSQNTAPRYDYSSPLSLMEFWRILLDEVQTLKSDNTQIAKCTGLLNRIHTWGVSGTPIQTIKDFQTVLSYLKFHPFVEQNHIITTVNNNFIRGNECATLKNGINFSLQDLMLMFMDYDICIRHSKKDVLDQIHLPKQTNFIIPLEFNPIEWDNYLNLWNDFIAVSGYGPNGENKTVLNSNELNQWLMKLRYLCCHAIIPENIMSMFNNSRLSRGRRRKNENGNPKNFDDMRNVVHNIDDILEIMTEDAIANLEAIYRDNYQLQIKSAQATMELQDNPIKGIDLLKEIIKNMNEDLKRKFNIHHILTLNINDLKTSDRGNVRFYLDLLHQCYFFIGTGYYFLGSKKLDQVDEENEKIKLIDDGKPLKKVEDFYSPDELEEIKKYQVIEKQNYEIAEELRRQLLSERANKVSEVIEEIRTIFRDQPNVPTTIDIIDFNHDDDFSSNYLVSKSFQSLSSMIKLFNRQADQFNDLICELKSILFKPVSQIYTENNEDEKAQEYATSLDDQDKLFALFHCLEEILKNRDTIITSEEDTIKLTIKKSLLMDPTYSDYHIGLLGNLALIEECTPLKSIFNDLGNSKIVRTSLDTHGGAIPDNFEDYLLQYSSEISKISSDIKKLRESLKKLNAIYNAKVEYYSQLQRISDSLVSLIQLEPHNRNLIMKAIRHDKKYKENLIRISQNESRIKYLKNLSKLKELIESDKSFSCAICLNIIHTGSIIKCGHFFCHDCIHSWLRNKKTCPICKQEANTSELYNFKFKNFENIREQENEPTRDIAVGGGINKDKKMKLENFELSLELKEEEAKYDSLLFNDKYKRFPQFNEVSMIKIKESFGAKIDFVIKLILFLKLKAEAEKDKPPQILLYSQNFEFLKIITKILKLNHISHLNCLSNSKSISNTIDKFKRDSQITCLLLNVKTLGAGLNLLNARHIFLLDPIISHNDELQAMSRNNRIGQCSETFVWNFMIRDSVEENIMRYKCLLEGNKNEETNHLSQEERDDVVSENETDTSLEISDNNTELVSERHLWNCFFQK